MGRDRRESTAEAEGIRAYHASAAGPAALKVPTVHCTACFGWSAPGPKCAHCGEPREGRAA